MEEPWIVEKKDIVARQMNHFIQLSFNAQKKYLDFRFEHTPK